MSITVPCEVTECTVRIAAPMGHRFCAQHCQCLSEAFMYKPSRCELCKGFITKHFIAQDNVDIIAKGRSELVAHIRKLSRHVEKSSGTLGLPLFIQAIRKKSGKPIRVDYFAKLDVPEGFDDPDCISVSKTLFCFAF